MEKKKSERGGRREGSGRKKTGKVFKNMTISGTEKELNSLREQARALGKSVCRFVIEALVPEDLRS